MVRGKITERYRDKLLFLYTPEAKNILNEKNREAMKNLFSRKD
jgi:long-chain acyl-CoA synthetase